ncbi:hypothetical protein ACFE04_023989 [Oxalis oulophora]
MAQLPPRAPNVTQNWHPFSHPHHQKLPTTLSNFPTNTTSTSTTQQPSWMDEFLDFSSVKRGTHRRSASDSITFLEVPSFAHDDNSSSSTNHHGHHHMAAVGVQEEEDNCFDRIDDEQLMSMFSDDMGMSTVSPPPPPLTMSNPSTPSDQNSNNDIDEMKPTPLDLEQQQPPKNEPGEVECSSFELEALANNQQLSNNANGDLVCDPKRVKRILANRQSAQRSRVRKLQYISELERSVTSLQNEVSALSPRVAFLDHQRLILNVDNSALKQRIAALAQDKIFKDAHQEALKKEIERLRQIYQQQQQNMKKQNNNNNVTIASTTNGGAPPSTSAEASHSQQQQQAQAMDCTDKEIVN